MIRTVSAAEAKTHFSDHLRASERGESIVITRHGKEVARLVPPPGRAAQPDVATLVARWKKARKNIKLGALKIRDLINDGQR